MSTSKDPVFVLFAARSGSTLFRVLVDTHPEIASPAETHIAHIGESLDRVWKVLAPETMNSGALPDARLREIARIVAQPLDSYAEARGKARWCDKSLDNAFAYPLLAALFPDARFVLLVRHCLDVVVSGLDACRWGFGGYGFDPYVRASPDNTVRALVNYWCDYTERLLRARGELGDRAMLVRYEDLVRGPDKTMAEVFSFLRVVPVEDISAVAFTAPHDVSVGDHKVVFTDGVLADRIGRGRQVPITLVDSTLRTRMNAALVASGYAEVGADWNHGSEVVPTASVTAAAEAARFVLGPAAPVPARCRHDRDAGGSVASVVLEDAAVCWVVDCAGPALRYCDRICSRGSLITDSTTLRGIVSGQLNAGGALRSGALRARGGVTLVAAVVEALRAIRG